MLKKWILCLIVLSNTTPGLSNKKEEPQDIDRMLKTTIDNIPVMTDGMATMIAGKDNPKVVMQGFSNLLCGMLSIVAQATRSAHVNIQQDGEQTNPDHYQQRTQKQQATITIICILTSIIGYLAEQMINEHDLTLADQTLMQLVIRKATEVLEKIFLDNPDAFALQFAKNEKIEAVSIDTIEWTDV